MEALAGQLEEGLEAIFVPHDAHNAHWYQTYPWTCSIFVKHQAWSLNITDDWMTLVNCTLMTWRPHDVQSFCFTVGKT